MPKIFRLKPEAFAKRIPVMVVRPAFVFALCLSFVLFMRSRELESSSHFDGFLIIVLLLPVLVAGFSIWQVIRRQRQAWNSFELIIDEKEVRRGIGSHRDVVITRQTVSKITGNRKGDLTIFGKGKLNVIGVPADLAGLPELREILAGWKPIETRNSLIGNGAITGVLLAVAMMYGAWFNNNRWIVLGSTVWMAGLCIWFNILAWTSAHLDKRLRRTSWISIFPLLPAIFHSIQLFRS